MASTTKLYSRWISSCSWRVRTALAMKKVPYEYVVVIKEKQTEEFKALNPAQLVPTLVIDGHTITESLAIIEYLEETHPEPSLLPKDAAGRAKVRAMSLHIVAGIQPIQNNTVLNYVGEKKLEWAQHWITKGLNSLETMLAKTAGRYSYGDTVTMVDLCLVPQIYNAVLRYPVDLSAFPTCKRVYDELLKLDAFQVSHPSRQPDTPENEKVTT